MTRLLHLCIGTVKECVNPDSYGCICVRCNKCGRFDKVPQVEPVKQAKQKEGYEPPEGQLSLFEGRDMG